MLCVWRKFECRPFLGGNFSSSPNKNNTMSLSPLDWVIHRPGLAIPSVRMHLVKANMMPYHIVTLQSLQFVGHLYIILSALKFETYIYNARSSNTQCHLAAELKSSDKGGSADSWYYGRALSLGNVSKVLNQYSSDHLKVGPMPVLA